MQVVNNKEEAPLAHYRAMFAQLEPQEAADRCGVAFSDGAFQFSLLGTPYRITWPEFSVRSEREDAFALKNLPCQTFLLRFLLEGKRAAESSHFQTFREMPWGELYVAPYTGRCLKRAAFAFGTRIHIFKKACEEMGALGIPHGDAGYQFDFLGGYRMQLFVYAGDEEFAPGSQILYSDNFADSFSAEDRVVAGDILISVVQRQMKAIESQAFHPAQATAPK